MDKATEEWLNSQKKSSKAPYKTNWNYFMQFTGLNGDQILESRKADKEYLWEQKTLEFKRWMIEVKGQSEYSGTSAATAVRSFFTYHRLTLQFRRPEKKRIAEAERKYEDYRFSQEDLKKMFDIADLTEKYVLTVGKSFGLRAGDFLALTKGDLEPYLDRPTPISIGEINTHKERAKAFPFIDFDALPIIKLMIEKIKREGRTEHTEKMLKFKDEIQLSRVLKRLTGKAGLNVGNKNVRFHCLRKYLIDRLSSFMSESKWKQIVGKKISEGAYVSPDSLKEDYARAMNTTCFTKPTFEGDMKKQIQKEILLDKAKELGISEEQLQTMFVSGTKKGLRRTSLTIDEEVKILEKAIEERKRKGDTNCDDGIHCGESEFKQIGEAELLRHLNDGWQIVHRLGNGDLIVKR